MADDSTETPTETDGAVDDAVDDVDGEESAPEPESESGSGAVASEPVSEKADRKAKADAVVAARKVERRVVTSRRITPKAGAKVEASTASSKARDAKKTEALVSRTPPAAQQTYSKGPSPWWVPALMFSLLILGGLVIIANYMGVFGEPDNIRLVAGLGLILGGIITATQYR